MAVTRRILTMDKQEVLLRWAGARIGIDSWRSDSYALGLLEPDGRVIAVGVLNMFHDQGAWVHLAADRSRNWLCAPELLPQVFAWPFIELGLERLTARIAMSRGLCLYLRYGRRNWHALWLLAPMVCDRVDWMREVRRMRRPARMRE